jgi:hypothetical protein
MVTGFTNPFPNVPRTWGMTGQNKGFSNDQAMEAALTRPAAAYTPADQVKAWKDFQRQLNGNLTMDVGLSDREWPGSKVVRPSRDERQ